jgi:hypothetical protein
MDSVLIELPTLPLKFVITILYQKILTSATIGITIYSMPNEGVLK